MGAERHSRDPIATYEAFMVSGLFAPGAERLLRQVGPQPGERLLDLACGTGIVARGAASRIGATGRVVGLDRNRAMLAFARSLPTAVDAGMTWCEGDALALPLATGAFDVVICQQALQFFPDRAQAAREMRRVLVPGGRVGIVVNQPLAQNPVWQHLNTAIEQRIGIPALVGPFTYGDAGALHQLLTEAGFTRVQVGRLSYPVSFPDFGQFVALTILGSAAAVPALGKLDAAARSALIDAIRVDVEPLLSRYRDGDGLATELSVIMATAQA